MRNYVLKTGAEPAKSNNALVAYIADRYAQKTNIYNQRKVVIQMLKSKMRFLLSVYNPKDSAPLGAKSKDLYYKSMLAHQANNTLMASKLNPDFIDYAPLGLKHDKDLNNITEALTRAHMGLRYQGLYDLAVQQSKKDLIWGNSFIEMVLKFDGDEVSGVEYQHCPFEEMRNYYGEPDRIRAIEYSPEAYAKEYGEEELEDVSLGGIVQTQDKYDTEQSLKFPEGMIQVVRYYNDSRKIFAEIHGGNGKIYQNLEDEKYPLIGREDEGWDPFLESRFYEDPTAEWFGYGVMDFLVDFADLDTSITNAVAADAVWSASAPTIIASNESDKMRASLRSWEKQRAQGRNRVMVQKDSKLGMSGKVIDLTRPVRTDLMETFDGTIISRATRASNLDFNSLAEYAPTAEQQKMKKIEADKLNIRVLQLNEQREIAFARKEMYFLKNTKTPFHNYEIEVNDQFAEKYQSPNGFKPMLKKKIGTILDETNDLHLQIQPRLEGALSDQSILEIRDMMDTIAIMPQGSQAQIIALEQMISKKNPELGITREDYVTPAMPEGAQEQEGAPALQETALGEVKAPAE